MYSHLQRYTIITFIILSVMGCVENPNVTEEIYLENPNAASSWVVGLQRQLAVTTNTVNINTAITSDNYFNNYSQYSKVFDRLQIDYFDTDVNNLQADILTLREMAKYGLETVLISDESSTDSDLAYHYFCLGYANMLGGELFTGLPDSNRGEVQNSQEMLSRALEALDQAIGIEPSETMLAVYQLLKARIYYDLGDSQNALATALSASENADILFQVKFDGQNGVSNEMQNATYDALPNRLAPLPRLDFLDPKYFSVGTASIDQKPVAIAKIEEAYLIMAEAYLAETNIASAKSSLLNLLGVVSKRSRVEIDDKAETRNGGNRDDYPLEAVPVRFDESSIFMDGYVLDRQQDSISVYPVSATKVDSTDIEDAANTEELLYLVYRLRQEIFISEGRRLTDLGIKFPVSQIEADNNPNVSDEYTVAQIPDFLPVESMDDFRVEEDGSITIIEDLNRIIVTNRNSPYVIPFFN